MTPDAMLIAILTAIALGVLGWIAYTTHCTAVSVAEIGAELKGGHEKFESHARELLDLRTKIVSIEIELAKLRR